MNAHTPIKADARAATSEDQLVGTRLRIARSMAHMSQSDLGDKLGLTFQQIQKYERGTNRIPATRLRRIALILDLPITYFFEDLDEGRAAPPPGALPQDGQTVIDFVQSAEGLAAVRALAPLPPSILRRIIDLGRALQGGA